jgi:arginine/lysine/ornithine decarboxylase
MNDQSLHKAAPLFEALLRYSRDPGVPFHTPGHKAGLGLEPEWRSLPDWSGLDLTEIAGLAWEPALTEAQELAARLFGAAYSFFLTQGATQGLIGAMLGVFPPGSTVLVARHCHAAVIHGLILADLHPVYVAVDRLPHWGLPAGINRRSLEEALAAHPEASGLVMTNPTYQGIAEPLAPIRRLLAGRILLIDEAHGGHLGWSGLKGYDACGCADLWVQGTHKIHGSLTQTGLLHVARTGPPLSAVRRGLDLIGTSSPSFILLASLDSARRFLALKGRDMFGERLPGMADLKERLARLAGVAVLTDRELDADRALDPWKLVIALNGQSGYELERSLYGRFGIQPEYAAGAQVTFFMAPWQQAGVLERLYQAVADISRQTGQQADSRNFGTAFDIPPLILKPRAAAFAPRQSVPLRQAAGRVAATTVAPYPPGIPVLAPGELIRDPEIQGLFEIERQGGTIRGLDPDGGIAVVKE